MQHAAKILVIACGAIARELVRIRDINQWDHIEFQCLPAKLHTTPERIPAAVKAKIKAQAGHYEKVFVAYADCGTGGALDRVLNEYGIERIAGAHCYEFYAGQNVFQHLTEAELGTFYLTDFLVAQFERLVVEGLGLNKHPQLMDEYFRHYKRVVYLAQTRSIKLQQMARKQAEYLGLEYRFEFCGDGPLTITLAPALSGDSLR